MKTQQIKRGTRVALWNRDTRVFDEYGEIISDEIVNGTVMVSVDESYRNKNGDNIDDGLREVMVEDCYLTPTNEGGGQ